MASPASLSPSTPLDDVLAAARAQSRAALATYLPVGYPDPVTGLDALHQLAHSADIVELGVPHTHPVLDGPVIQHAVAQALTGGFHMRDLFSTTEALTASSTAAMVVMSYWAPIARYGPADFARHLAAAGGSGVLIPDLPSCAASTWRKTARAAGLHTIPLIPPHASAARLAAIGAVHSGMAYAPATPGTTGASRPLSPYLPRLVRRVRKATGLPVAVGIGIGTPEQAMQVSAYADTVVVGSAVIRRMQAHRNDPAAAAAAAAYDFADAVRSIRRPAA
jgi:tryptophan synthase alpha chain